MKFFKFIAWYWRNLDVMDRIMWVTLSSAAISTLAIITWGKTAMLVVVGMFATAIVLGLLWLVALYFRDSWDRYTEECEKDIDEVLSRLTGTRQK